MDMDNKISAEEEDFDVKQTITQLCKKGIG